MTIYKICDGAAWRRCEQEGELPWSKDDLRDGFVHLSSAAQVRESCAKHFAGKDDLWLLEVDASALEPGALRWERSRGGLEFPHLYGPLARAAIVRADPIVRDGDAFTMPAWCP